MPRTIFLILILLAVTAVAIADVFLKKAALGGSLSAALKSPWFFGALALYLFQIFFYTYVFVLGFELSVVGIMQTILYALIIVGAGLLLFQETLSPLQITGMVLGIAGVILINLGK